ncbi:Aste57867_17411 [Aphanomyces stellatus]|uniref:Aste57867_16052 protein n=1 Tax=Aphanomyces stellatus TaxID=120398 RepID=A0A485L9I2_9STRA|nr:hypothetical protein As57867_017351 [Aphanomyces stellatus]KAF0692922.1 hypothetical protein As57867_015996 [Aphanomyces stellatus]VFT92836.1 Aste57867_16052 [Aphanomyces stellatus]VFT94167.1 Aste57867_17411 [Aphanomyces stellatus]
MDDHSTDFLVYGLLHYVQTSAAKFAKQFNGNRAKATSELHDWYKAVGGQYDDAALPQIDIDTLQWIETMDISLKIKKGPLKSEIKRVKSRSKGRWIKDTDESYLKELETKLAITNIISDMLNSKRDSLRESWFENCSFECDKANGAAHLARLKSIIGRVSFEHVANPNNPQVSLTRDQGHRIAITSGICDILTVVCNGLCGISLFSVTPADDQNLDDFIAHIIGAALLNGDNGSSECNYDDGSESDYDDGGERDCDDGSERDCEDGGESNGDDGRESNGDDGRESNGDDGRVIDCDDEAVIALSLTA